MKIRKHKNDRWFHIVFVETRTVSIGHRWTGEKMVPREVKREHSPRQKAFRFGSDAHAIRKVFKRHRPTAFVYFITPATPDEVASIKLHQSFSK